MGLHEPVAQAGGPAHIQEAGTSEWLGRPQNKSSSVRVTASWRSTCSFLAGPDTWAPESSGKAA